MARRTDREITAALSNVTGRREERAADGDIQVRKAIEAAIELQKKDPDLTSHDADQRVLELLHQSLEAQIEDEATDEPEEEEEEAKPQRRN